MTCFQSRFSPESSTNFHPAIPDNNDDLGNEITRLAGHINAVNYRFLKLLAALVERSAWNGHGIKSPAHWLNYYCGISLGPAREKVRVAQCLKSLPLIDAAFSKGEISYSKVRAMTRAATPDNENYLLMIARHGTASHVEKLVRQYERVERLSTAEQGKVQQEARQFSYYYDDDGMLVFKGKLAPEDGAVFLKAMEAVLHQINEETFQRERESESESENQHDNSSADAATPDISAKTSLPAQGPDTFPQKRADALLSMAEHYLATAKDGPVPLNGGDKYQVVVHINTDANRGATGPQAYLDNGPVLSAQTVKRLASEASRVTVLKNGKGKVLNVGRKTRTVPQSIRRALSIRDGGCRFPGCCESRYVDAHHIHHWCDGGETSLDNLVLLCRHHHRLIHEAGYAIDRDGAGNPRFMDSTGQPMSQVLYPQFENGDVSAETLLAIERQHAENGLEIDDSTAVTTWQGEVMDYGMALEALWNRRDGNIH